MNDIAKPRSPSLEKRLKKWAAVLMGLIAVGNGIAGVLSFFVGIFSGLRKHLPLDLDMVNSFTFLLISGFGALLCIIISFFALHLARDDGDATGESSGLARWCQRIGSFQHWLTYALVIVALLLGILLVGRIERYTRGHVTEYVGRFPEDMITINKHLDDARRDMLIVVDFAAFGRFSDPDRFEEYKARIDNLLHRHVNVTIVSYSKDTAKKELTRRFGCDPEKGGAQWVHFQDKFKDMYAEYNRHYRNGLAAFSDFPEFIEDLCKANEDLIVAWRGRGANIAREDEPFRVFAWIKDSEEAVYTFRSRELFTGPESHVPEVTFHTIDPRLVGVFEELYGRYRKR